MKEMYLPQRDKIEEEGEREGNKREGGGAFVPEDKDCLWKGRRQTWPTRK